MTGSTKIGLLARYRIESSEIGNLVPAYKQLANVVSRRGPIY